MDRRRAVGARQPVGQGVFASVHGLAAIAALVWTECGSMLVDAVRVLQTVGLVHRVAGEVLEVGRLRGGVRHGVGGVERGHHRRIRQRRAHVGGERRGVV